jgi:hypothetical protein
MLPNIPGDIRVILIERFVRFVSGGIRDFIQEDIPRIAEEQEDALNAELAQARVGGKFLSQPIVAETADTVTLLTRFVDVGIPGVENVKLRLARAELEIERRVNLTTSTMPPIFVRDIPAFAIEIVEETKTHQIAIGGGFEEITGAEQYRVGIRWETPEVYFRGLLAVRENGGFLIDVHSASDFCIPLAASGFGLKGAGLLYGEHFAPDLRDPGSTEPVVARMERASAGEYLGWARKNDLERWAPVDESIRTFGVSGTFCDVLCSGQIVVIEEAGIAFIDYGPILVFGGRVKILKTTDAGDLLGAVDVRSKSFFGRSNMSIDAIPWAPDAIRFTGVNELSASLKDQNKTWWAMGGYGMDGCRLKILGFLELWGGMRIIPLQGAAVRGGGRAEGQVEFIGTGAGYSLAIDANARFGWNPLALGGNLRVSGDAWLKIFGKKLGAGISADLGLQLPKPLELRLYVEFRLSLPWPLSDKTFGTTIFSLLDREVRPADPPIALAAGAGLGYIHGPSGTLGELTGTTTRVWPDVAFDLVFQRSAAGPRTIVNPPSLAGVHEEGGIRVSHRISQLEIAKLDSNSNEVVVPGVSASWLLSKSGGGTVPTSRLAIPCNDPLGWLNSFDYAEPDTVKPLVLFVLQTFGSGPAETIPTDPATHFARVHVERLVVESRSALALIATPWAGDYGRLLGGGGRYVISIAGPEAGGSTPLAVREYEIRVIEGPDREPDLALSGGTVTGATVVQHFADNSVEWAISISRQPSEYRDPIEIGNGESGLSLAAVGYRLDGMSEVEGGTITVLEPGRYRLHLQGESEARSRHGSETTGWTPIARDFEVVRPPLRPYLKFATFGDERIFGLSAQGWNPNPRGSGFGHYQDHLGVIRARVSYLSKIYDRLWISPREDVAPVAVRVAPARDGSLAGSRSSREWEIATGQAPAPEEELVLQLPSTSGLALARIYFSLSGDGTDLDLTAPLDQWTYRVSAYTNPVAHLKPAREALSWAYGPFGARRLDLTAGSALPAGFDFAASPAAKLKAGWALPAEIARLAKVSDASAGLGFLKLLEWAGVFRTSAAAEENVLIPPPAPELALLLDTAASPVGLLLRTSEPCDWRRVEANIVVGDLDGSHVRLSARLAPSGDGCASIVLLEADGVPVRVTSGPLALQIRFHLACAGLPRLTHTSDPDQADEVFSLLFDQPYGPAWPL